MRTTEQLRVWKHFWKRMGMYIAMPASVDKIDAFWAGFACGQSRKSKSAYLYHGDFWRYVERRLKITLGASGLRGELRKKFGDGKKAEERKVVYLTKLAHVYGAERFGSEAYSKCKPL